MNTVIQKALSYSGRITRIEYLIYGLILPIVMFVVGSIMSQLGSMGNLINVLFFLMGLSMALSSIIKRARDTNQNTTLVVILFFIFMIIAILIGLFAPTRTTEKQEGSAVVIIIVVVFIIVILGILAAVAIPKLAATQEDAKAAIEATQQKVLEMQTTKVH